MAACEVKLLIFVLLSSSCSCHYLPEPEDIIQGVPIHGKHLLGRRSTEQSLRISVNAQSPSIKNLESSKRSLIVDRLLPEAVAYFSKTLNVRRAMSPIRLQRNCKSGQFAMKSINGKGNGLFRFCIGECDVETKCGTVRVPTTHLDVCRTCNLAETRCVNETGQSVGVRNADFVLYVSAIHTSHCKKQEDVVAYAAVCQQEQSLDRPVAGFVNFCEENLSDTIHFSHLLAIIKHEIFHALGFSSSLYGYYRADDGTPLTNRRSDGRPIVKWSDKVVKEIVRQHWNVSDTAGSSIPHKVELIVTPRVVKEARDHFNCPSLEGAEIENQGGSGQKQTHWEKRLFENEAMTGVFTHNPVFSRITLALMEDTGWYKVNYDMAETLDWGRNAGCLFVQNSCKAWMDYKARKRESILPYCAELSPKTYTRTGCTHGYESVGTCNLVKYNFLLPVDYRYFSALPGTNEPGYYGGATTLADFCPFYQELDWKKNGVTIRGSSCKHVSNSIAFDQNYALEEYGENSSCFLHGKKWTRRSCKRTVTSVDWGSGCYTYACTKEGVVLSVMGHSYQCWFAGQKLEVKLLDNRSWLHEGSLICPLCRDLCGDSCPLEEIVRIFNSSSDERSHQQDLVCSSSGVHPNFSLIAFVILSFHACAFLRYR